MLNKTLTCNFWLQESLISTLRLWLDPAFERNGAIVVCTVSNPDFAMMPLGRAYSPVFKIQTTVQLWKEVEIFAQNGG